jgi:polar amino acid transport system substrate-binding protein
MKTRSMLKNSLVALAVTVGALSASLSFAAPLRVCADPDNLPFSKSDGAQRGLFVELAELVGKRLDTPVEFVWWLTFNQRRALRSTILQDGCDAYFALPADADYKVRGLARTQAFIDVSYALVAPSAFNLTTLSDIKGKRIAVLHGSPPHILLSRQTGYTTVSFKQQEEAFEALNKGEADMGLLWGPSAGFENKNQTPGRWKVTPVSGEGLSGQMAVAVQRTNAPLLASIDKALTELKPEINGLAQKYGFPLVAPILLVKSSVPAQGQPDALARSRTVNTGWVAVADTPPPKPAAKPKAAPKDSAANSGITSLPSSSPPLGPEAKLGRVRFNDACSHCHGTDGFSPVIERDLRRLKIRYKDNWRETAQATIISGRPDAGMPTWKDVYKEKEIAELLDFLTTMQK